MSIYTQVQTLLSWGLNSNVFLFLYIIFIFGLQYNVIIRIPSDNDTIRVF